MLVIALECNTEACMQFMQIEHLETTATTASDASVSVFDKSECPKLNEDKFVNFRFLKNVIDSSIYNVRNILMNEIWYP